VKNTYYEAPNYAVFSIIQVQIFSSALYSETSPKQNGTVFKNAISTGNKSDELHVGSIGAVYSL
jgi:hypothetical protein